MFQPWAQSGASITRAPLDLHRADAGDRARPHVHRADTALPPRPVEPRPPLHTMLTESTGRMGLHESRPYQEHPPSEHHSRSRNLPALRDVLSQDYSSSSGPNCVPRHPDAAAASTNGIGNGNGLYPLTAFHPPMVLPAPSTMEQRYWSDGHARASSSHVPDSLQPQVNPPPTFGAYPDHRPRYADASMEIDSDAKPAPRLRTGSGPIYNDYVPTDEAASRIPAPAVPRGARDVHQTPHAEGHGKYLRVETVPGEGEFFVYEDGLRIPTHVDGEQVNPKWGLTKANKPRKRLATACLDCREKKIKCEPGATSCMQCDKAMRPCRKPAERYSQADTPANVMYVGGSPVRKDPAASESSRASTRTTESEYLHKRRIRADPSPPLAPVKKHRDISAPHGSLNGVRPQDGDVVPATAVECGPPESPPKDSLAWAHDPYAVDPETTMLLLNVYFERINNAVYCIFPRRHFLTWVREYGNKCQNERMVLYSMLAAASVFAGDEFAGFGKQCSHVAADAFASQLGRFNIGTAASKLLLALFHLAKGAENSEWDYIGSAIRTVTNMELNTEAGCLDDEISRGQQRFEFAFTPEQLAECKRRIFWCTFLQDRFCGPTMCMLKPEDIFVRLPCQDEAYENSAPSDAPYFANGIIDTELAGSITDARVASVAWLIPVVAAWGDVTDFIFRASHRSEATYKTQYQSFYAATQARLQDWTDSLPERWQYNPSNLRRGIQEGYAETLVLMHTLYHYSMIKLNRYMRHRLLPDIIVRNIRAANHHAHRMLQIMNDVQAARPDQADFEQPVIVFTSPIVAFAVTSAIDIVSAGGDDSKFGATLVKIDKAICSLQDLEQHWNIVKNHKIQCQTRYYQLTNITKKPTAAKTGCWLGRKWGTVEPPLENEFEGQNDCIYGLGEREGDEASQLYFEAFNEE